MNKTILTVLVGASVALSTPSFAGGIYVGGIVNKTDINTDFALNGSPLTDFDTDNTEGYGLTLGVNMNSYTAFEYEIADFGSGTTNIGAFNDNTISWHSRAQTVWVVFDPTLFNINTMPLKLTLRGGLAYTKISSDFGTYADTGTALGAGFALGVTNNLDIILDCRTRNVKESYYVEGFRVSLDSTVQTYNIGANYRF